MEYAVIFGVIVVGLVIFSWQMTARTRAWVIRMRNGVPFLTKGKIARTVVAELADVLQRMGFVAPIYGVRGTVRPAFLGRSRTASAGAAKCLVDNAH